MKIKSIRGVDYTGVSVVYFCHDGNGKFVMGHRNENARDEKHRWDIGGGAVEFGENVEETLHKEIRREYGAKPLSIEFLGFRDVHRAHDDKKSHWVTFDFKVLVDPSSVKNGEPHKFHEVTWFTHDSMPKNIHSQLPHFLQKYKDKLFH